MRQKRILLAASAASAATFCVVAGCSSLLGDFSSGPAAGSDSGRDVSSPGADAGDGAIKTASDAADAPANGDVATADADAAQGPPVLTCNGYNRTNDLVLATLVPSGGNPATFNNPLYVFHTTAGIVQVFAGANDGSGYSIYAFQADESSPGLNITTIGPPQPNYLLGASPVAGGVLAWSLAGIGTAPGEGANTTFVPASFLTGTLTPQVLISDSELPAEFYTNLNVSLTPVAANDYFYFLYFGNVAGSPTTYTLATGRTTNGDAGAPVVFSQNTTTQPSYSSSLINDGTNAYAFSGTDPTMGSTSIQTLPLVPNGMPATTRTLGSTSLDGNMLVATAAPSAASPTVFNIAGAVLNLTTTSVEWRIGQVAAGMLASFTGADLVAAGNLSSINDLPFNNGNAGWVGDDALFIGKGPAAATPGFNFFWFDAQGNQRVAAGANAAGTAYGILADHTGTQMAAITVNQIITPGLAQFDLVWTEQYTGDAGVYQVLKYNVLVCHQ